MELHDIYIKRCLELAQSGFGNVAPNPMVGCVIVHNDKIIGEGFHREFGGHHAEVNAINSVRDSKLLKEATLYVSLEPCSHYGKTPPCANLIIQHEIPKVVIGVADPNIQVTGNGIRLLKDHGCEVIVDVLNKDCIELNKRFFTFHYKQRPYIILKWAQTLDEFIDLDRSTPIENKSSWISNDSLKRIVHLWRSQEQSILVGYNTALVDNPKLTLRLASGKNPLRIVYDPKNELPNELHLFDHSVRTLIFSNENNYPNKEGIETIVITNNSEIIDEILMVLYQMNIQSVIIEGGKRTLEMFIEKGLWDETRILVGNKTFGNGNPAPKIKSELVKTEIIHDDKIMYYDNPLQSLKRNS